MRLATKENRLQVQKFEFENLLKKGYAQEVYKDLNIFTMTDSDSTWLKVFKGTSTNAIIYKRYRVEPQNIEVAKEKLIESVKNVKASHDRNLAYKAELKNNPTRSSSANCATAIREELKKEFAGVKFSVKSSNFSGGDSVHIQWTDGPTYEEVNNIVKKYQYGNFNGMEDIYEYSNRIEGLPQSKYVQTYREISDEVNKAVFESLKTTFSSEDAQDYEIKQDCYRIIRKSSIPLGAIVTGLERTGQSGLLEDCYRLTFDLPAATEKNQESSFEKVEIKEGQIQIVDYSEKAIAVIGDTKAIKDKLKELGGKFNFRLSCGAGWIFKKSDLSKVEFLLSNI